MFLSDDLNLLLWIKFYIRKLKSILKATLYLESKRCKMKDVDIFLLRVYRVNLCTGVSPSINVNFNMIDIIYFLCKLQQLSTAFAYLGLFNTYCFRAQTIRCSWCKLWYLLKKMRLWIWRHNLWIKYLVWWRKFFFL